MGRIADADQAGEYTTSSNDEPFTNKVDSILDDLDDDDRAVVLSWLLSDLAQEVVELRLLRHDIRCSDTTIRRWRLAQAEGVGRRWVP